MAPKLEPAALETDAAARAFRPTATPAPDPVTAERARISSERLLTAVLRDEVARARDQTAAERDRTTRRRDEADRLRAEEAQERQLHALAMGNVDEAIAALRAMRRAGAAVRRRAEMSRRAAAADRLAAAADREKAAADRHHSGLDDLTGSFRRGTGEVALTNEMARARRYRQPLALVMFDVDRLKHINDTRGHAAGDALLRDVAGAIRSTMRSYDVMVRWGGDEFICALSNATLPVAAERVRDIQEALDHRRPGATLSAGLAALDEEDGGPDTLDRLVARADAALYSIKDRRRR